MEKRFRALRIVAIVLKVLAWIVLVMTVLGGCGSLVMGLMAGGTATRGTLGLGLDPLSGVIGAFVAIFFGILYFILLYASSEMIDVMLALEENTRTTAEHLKNLGKT